MNSKTTITLSAATIAAVVLLFATGPIVGSQQAFAYGYGGYGGYGYHHHHHYYGGYGGYGGPYYGGYGDYGY